MGLAIHQGVLRFLSLALLPLLLLCAVTGKAAVDKQEQQFFIHNGDSYVFYGDSITDSEWYPTLVQTFVLTRFPQWRNQFCNRGLSGDNTGSLQRFGRDVGSQQPQAFSLMMGYNDGGYQPLTTAGLTNFISNLEQSVAMARAKNPNTRIFLISPTPAESDVSDDARWVSHDYYAFTLLNYARAEGRLAQRLGINFVDMTTLYGSTLGLGRVMAHQGFALSRDGVHPQQEGQTFIAYHLLRAMGAQPLLAEVQIDARAGKLLAMQRCKVSGLKMEKGALSFTRQCDSLPYPTPEVARPFTFLVQLDDTINADTLKVTGLTAPRICPRH